MGNCVAVPSFRGSYKVSAQHSTCRSTDDEREIERSKKGNYHVYCNLPQNESASPFLPKIYGKNRKKQTNRIKTTRYNIITFIPKNLFEQFHRIANVYFAILIGLNWIPIITAISKTVKFSNSLSF